MSSLLYVKYVCDSCRELSVPAVDFRNIQSGMVQATPGVKIKRA